MAKYTKEDILRIANEENVKYIRLQFTDMLGTLKNVEIPINKLEEALDGNKMFDGSSVEGFVRIQEADMFLMPDLDTWLIQTWEDTKYGKVARLVCDIYDGKGHPFIGDPRSNLKRVLKEMEELGFDGFNIGTEPEFFLFKLDANGKPTLEFNDNGGYFDLSPVDGAEDCRRDIVLELMNIGFEMEASHHEVAPGQHEINFKYANALEACDNLQTFKLVVKNVARRHGQYATFMPKPIRGINGSGMHMNCSLTRNGKNAFYDPEKPLQLSDTARLWINGIVSHAREIAAITNPIVNSYKRLVPGYEAPCYVAWSDANRSAMIRIPASRGAATRTEVRNVDPAANPYLAFATILKAGLDGIKKGGEFIPPVYDNLYVMSREEREEKGIKNLPENLKDSVKELKKSTIAREALGEHIFTKFIEAKELEWDEYRKTIHQFEIDNYLKI